MTTAAKTSLAGAIPAASVNTPVDGEAGRAQSKRTTGGAPVRHAVLPCNGDSPALAKGMLFTDRASGFGPGLGHLSAFRFDLVREGAFGVMAETVSLGGMQAVRVRVTGPTEIRAAFGTPVHGVAIAVGGWRGSRCAGQALEDGQALAIHPGHDLWLVAGTDTEVLFLLIGAACLEHHAQAMRIAPPAAFSVTPPTPRFAFPRAAGVTAFCTLLLSRTRGKPVVDSPSPEIARLAEQGSVLLLCALLSHPRPRTAGRPRATYERLVARARDLVLGQPGSVPALPEVCDQLHVGLRTLNYAFQHALGVSAAEYLRVLRMNRVRETLLAAGSVNAAGISAIATHWGFSHPSQFARQYRQLFGERPSDTVGRARVRDGKPGGRSGTAVRRRREKTAPGRRD